MKHLIIEGCDGSGKTTLHGQLMQTGQFIPHARASDSLTGPVPALDRWVEIDLDQLDDLFYPLPFMYDRHPLVSEIIYADLRWKNPGLTGKFTDTNWLVETRRQMARQSVLIICQPPYAIVDQAIQTAGRDAHMPGVMENRHTIYKRYQEFVWPGLVIRYDWTRDNFEDLFKTIELEGKN